MTRALAGLAIACASLASPGEVRAIAGVLGIRGEGVWAIDCSDGP